MEVSIGFEVETQHFSICRKKKTSLSNPVFMYTIPFNKHVYVYPDEFTTSTKFASQTATAFINTYGAQTKHYALPTTVGTFTVTSPLSRLFRNLEFVATYETPTRIKNAEAIIPFMFSKYQSALDDIENVMKDFDVPTDVLDTGFPYTKLWTHPKITDFVLLSRGPMSSAYMTSQCTFGIPLTEAINVWITLARFATKVTGHKVYEDAIQEIHDKMRSILPRSEDPLLQNYLFLFLYAYETRGKRKTGAAFNIRHCFGTLWKLCLHKEKRDHLFSLLEKSPRVGSSLLMYFHSVHYKTRSVEQRKEHQDMEKVGIIPFKKKDMSFFFEFRAFSHIIKSIFHQQNEKGTRLTFDKLSRLRFQSFCDK